MAEESVDVKVARLEERLKASDLALKLAADSLDAWKENSSIWLELVKTQQQSYVSRSEVVAMIMVGLTLLGLILRFA